MQSNTRNLMSAISSLPQLTERKKTIDKHTNMATALLRQIQARALKQYWDREEDCLHGKPDLAAIETLLQVRIFALVVLQQFVHICRYSHLQMQKLVCRCSVTVSQYHSCLMQHSYHQNTQQGVEMHSLACGLHIMLHLQCPYTQFSHAVRIMPLLHTFVRWAARHLHTLT